MNLHFEKTAIIISNNYNLQTINVLKKNMNNKCIIINNTDTDFDFNIDYKMIIEPFDLAISIGCKNIITIGEESNQLKENYLYDNFNIHLFELENLSECEFLNIVNYKKFIFVSLTGNDDYGIGGLVRYFIKLHDKIDTSIKFIKSGYKIITYKNICKYIDLENKIISSIDKFINYINIISTNSQKNIIFNFHLYNIDLFIINKKNNYLVGWTNDPHSFAHYIKDENNEQVCVQTYSKKYKSEHLNKLDLLITPSPIYFKNLDITEYDHKIKFLFYILNPDFYNKLDYNNYSNRKNQIILSGTVNEGYRSRLYFNNLKTKSDTFNNLIYYQISPGNENNAHMTEMNYYNKLCEFKGAFVGHYNFPINFCLAKHIEILMCGCVGFFEKNLLLEKELGLIEFVHYIPCSDEKGNLIEDEKFYEEWLEKGNEIAVNGAKYVRERFGENYIDEYINIINKETVKIMRT